MITYTLGSHINGIPVYLTGLKEDGTPHFSSKPEEAAFGMLGEIEQLKALFDEKASHFGIFEIVEVTIKENEKI